MRLTTQTIVTLELTGEELDVVRYALAMLGANPGDGPRPTIARRLSNDLGPALPTGPVVVPAPVAAPIPARQRICAPSRNGSTRTQPALPEASGRLAEVEP